MHNEDLTAVDMQWQGKARQGKCRVSVEMKQITEISENPISRMYKVNIVKLKGRVTHRIRKTRVKNPNTKNAVYDGVKPFIAKKSKKISVKNRHFLSQFCKICKTNNTVAWSTFFRIF
ncbi:hypothetical protein T4A_10489 [Trichinella pseudospiralis]|uniref:Uncharacterized protein n=1 Tax=Trichinella pseudospiralis TaxID=6337 RepID=A0A0V1EZE6_TRIPS|nr:hypothetical protein T4A_10489 [Trichinella pseudospiralis]